MRIGPLAALSVAAASVAFSAVAGDVYVITHKGLNLAQDDIKQVYMGDKQILGSTKLVPMDNAGLQSEFLEKVLNMNAGKYGNIWTKKGFREGINPPSVKSGDSEVIAAVRSTPGSVGYVTSEPSGVKVIGKY